MTHQRIGYWRTSTPHPSQLPGNWSRTPLSIPRSSKAWSQRVSKGIQQQRVLINFDRSSPHFTTKNPKYEKTLPLALAHRGSWSVGPCSSWLLHTDRHSTIRVRWTSSRSRTSCSSRWTSRSTPTPKVTSSWPSSCIVMWPVHIPQEASKKMHTLQSASVGVTTPRHISNLNTKLQRAIGTDQAVERDLRSFGVVHEPPCVGSDCRTTHVHSYHTVAEEQPTTYQWVFTTSWWSRHDRVVLRIEAKSQGR